MFAISNGGVTQVFKPWDTPSFTERHAPSVFLPMTESPAATKKPARSLLEHYLDGDVSPLLRDAEERPTHYTAAQKALIERLRLTQPVSLAEKNELMLQYVRRTDAQKAEQQVRKKLTEDLVTPEQRPPAFEEQGLFQGAIKLI